MKFHNVICANQKSNYCPPKWFCFPFIAEVLSKLESFPALTIAMCLSFSSYSEVQVTIAKEICLPHSQRGNHVRFVDLLVTKHTHPATLSEVPIAVSKCSHHLASDVYCYCFFVCFLSHLQGKLHEGRIWVCSMHCCIIAVVWRKLGTWLRHFE